MQEWSDTMPPNAKTPLAQLRLGGLIHTHRRPVLFRPEPMKAPVTPMKNAKITWVAAIDGQFANFFTKLPASGLQDLNHSMQAQPVRTDTAGGRRDLGRAYDRRGGGRHIVEPHTSERTQQRRQFMREVAEFLHTSLEQGKYNRLVVAAPPKILGFLRQELSDAVRAVIVLELDKDLIQLEPQQIQEKLDQVIIF